MRRWPTPERKLVARLHFRPHWPPPEADGKCWSRWWLFLTAAVSPLPVNEAGPSGYLSAPDTHCSHDEPAWGMGVDEKVHSLWSL
jgi:hypothetical protein